MPSQHPATVITGTTDGLAYALVAPRAAERIGGVQAGLPAAAPQGGVVILHGAGSRKENHLDFAQLCAGAGLVAIAFDQRGHGASDGALGAGVLADVATIAALLPPGPVFLRGSSMGGFVAIAAAARVGARGVVAICPASGANLAAGVRAGRLRFRADVPALTDALHRVDLAAAARALGPDLLLQHAEGDDQVAVAHSAELHAAAAGSTFTRVPGGDHGSVQHDRASQDEAVRFLLARAGGLQAEETAPA